MSNHNPPKVSSFPDRVGSGSEDLDHILGGGFPKNRLHLVQGEPGAGKTTLALQFLMEGARLGEAVVCVTMSETEEEMQSIAASHGWSLDGIQIFEPLPVTEAARPDSQYTIFHPAEIELGHTMKVILDVVDRLKPSRLVIDSLSELRLLARDPLQYRRQVLALKYSLSKCPCTILLLDGPMADASDLQLRTVVHGVVVLEHLTPEVGSDRRRLRVAKMRGVKFRGGYHDFAIEPGGVAIYPRLVAAEHRSAFQAGTISSGLAELDSLLGGGLDRGTSTLLMGAAGSGKSVIASQFALTAAKRHEKVAYFIFDEAVQTLISRTESLGMSIRKFAESGEIVIQPIDPAEMTPGEFAFSVREAVETGGVRLVIIDSVNGLLNSMPEEKFLTIQLHEILTFLAQNGVVTILVVSQYGLLGGEIGTPVDVSYLADTVILLRYFECAGLVRKAVSVLKKRSGNHERFIRELKIEPGGIRVGLPLHQFQGVLTGLPTLSPNGGSLL